MPLITASNDASLSLPNISSHALSFSLPLFMCLSFLFVSSLPENHLSPFISYIPFIFCLRVFLLSSLSVFNDHSFSSQDYSNPSNACRVLSWNLINLGLYNTTSCILHKIHLSEPGWQAEAHSSAQRALWKISVETWFWITNASQLLDRGPFKHVILLSKKLLSPTRFKLLYAPPSIMHAAYLHIDVHVACGWFLNCICKSSTGVKKHSGFLYIPFLAASFSYITFI